MSSPMAILMTYQRVEVITGSEKRRVYSAADKAGLVAEAFRPGVVASEVARRHGLNVSLLYRWRRQIEEGQASPSPEPAVNFVPVRIADAPPSIPDDKMAPLPPAGTGIIEIVLPSGHCLRVDRHVDAGALRRVLAVLERR
ncbi:transposase (plasmid) [Azospirillum sp. B510]|nr:transposase [Azospirillum sp. B510]